MHQKVSCTCTSGRLPMIKVKKIELLELSRKQFNKRCGIMI